jgi:hypothetical protein
LDLVESLPFGCGFLLQFCAVAQHGAKGLVQLVHVFHRPNLGRLVVNNWLTIHLCIEEKSRGSRFSHIDVDDIQGLKNKKSDAKERPQSIIFGFQTQRVPPIAVLTCKHLRVSRLCRVVALKVPTRGSCAALTWAAVCCGGGAGPLANNGFGQPVASFMLRAAAW